MERRKCRRCGYPMTRMLTNDAGRWSACYTCLSCGYATAAVTAKSETAAEDGLERFMDRVDRAYEATAGRSAAPRKPQTAEAERALNAYGLYCQLCEALTGKPIAKMDELLTAAKKDNAGGSPFSAALHRAEPEMRPLTLEEVRAHCAKGPDAEPLWAEFKEECAISRWIFAVIPPDVIDRPVLSEWIATDRSEKYGKEWRCWPRKPTPEQMAAEKWEE